MKSGLRIVSFLMLILGVITLAFGLMDVALLNSADGGAVGDALIGLTVILFVVGGALDITTNDEGGGSAWTARESAASFPACGGSGA